MHLYCSNTWDSICRNLWQPYGATRKNYYIWPTVSVKYSETGWSCFMTKSPKLITTAIKITHKSYQRQGCPEGPVSVLATKCISATKRLAFFWPNLDTVLKLCCSSSMHFLASFSSPLWLWKIYSNNTCPNVNVNGELIFLCLVFWYLWDW